MAQLSSLLDCAAVPSADVERPKLDCNEEFSKKYIFFKVSINNFRTCMATVLSATTSIVTCGMKQRAQFPLPRRKHKL